MTEQVAACLNDQMNETFALAFHDLACADYCHVRRLHGFANWFEVEARKEMDSAMMVRSYLHQNGEASVLLRIPAARSRDWKLENPVLEAPRRAAGVLAALDRSVQAARQGADARTLQFLSWFVREMAGEEREIQNMVRKFETFGKNGSGREALNWEWMARAYTAPSLVV